MIAVPVFLLVSLALAGCGDRLARGLGLKPGPPGERLCLGFLLGLGILIPALFVLAVTRTLTTMSCLLLYGAMSAVAVMNVRELRKGPIRWPEFFPADRLDRLLCVLTGLFLFLGFVLAMAPPTGIDAGVYHFTIPKLIVQNHGLVPREDVWIHKSGTFYMVYAFGMALGSEILAKLLAYGAAVAGVGLCAAASERLQAGSGRAAAFIAASTPLSAGYLGYEFLELPILAFVWAGLLALLRAPEGRPWLFVLALFCGLAVSAKPTAFSLAVLLPAALLPALWKERARALPAAVGASLLFAAVAGCWSAWNYATTGHLTHRYQSGNFDAGGPAVVVPLWKGVLKTLGVAATTGSYWNDSAGPFIVAGVAGFLVFLRGEARGISALLLAAGVAGYLAVLCVFSPNHLNTEFGARYLAPCLIGFGAPVAAQFWVWARSREGAFRTLIVVALLLPAAPLLVLKAGKAAVAFPAAVGLESRSAYLGKKIETFAACEQLNALPDPGVRVLFMAVRPYYLDRDFIWVPYTGAAPFLRGLRGREDFLRRVREAKITHVLLEPAPDPFPGFEDPDAMLAPPFREIGRWPWKQTQSVRLYAVEGP